MLTLSNVANVPALVLSLVLVAGTAHADDRNPDSITLTGLGKASAPPDVVHLTSGVVSQNKIAATALSANSSAMNAVIDKLKAAGIASKDLQTTDFRVQPVYARQKRRADGSQPEPRITGYRVTNSLRITLREIKKIGRVLDTLVAAGSNSIGQISFAHSDPAALRNTARRKAFQEARQKAQLYADEGGRKLGRVMTISEAHVSSPGPARYARAMAAEAAPTPIEPGEQAVNARITVTWELVD